MKISENTAQNIKNFLMENFIFCAVKVYSVIHFSLGYYSNFLILKKFLQRAATALKISLREKCPCSELFSSVFSRIRTEYGKIIRKIRNRITPNTDTFYAESDIILESSI